MGRYGQRMSRLLLLGLVAAALLAPVPTGAAEPAPARGLAFERNGDIFLARADGSRPRNLTRTPSREYAPAWSPDGERLLFVGYRDGNAELYVARADGRGVRRVTRHRGEDLTPAWSPDGRRLAFASNRRGEYELYVANADGSGVRRLTRLARPGYGSFSPAWSPDGRRIAFSSAGPTPENPELYSIRPDGGGLKRLTRTKGDVETLGDDGMPSFSPDGRTIVFTSNRTGEGEVWVMRADGSGQRRLAGLPRRDDWAPRFAPDGRTIAFESRALGAGEIWLVRKDGTGARRLLRNAVAPAWRP